jgi:hypothetical protein
MTMFVTACPNGHTQSIHLIREEFGFTTVGAARIVEPEPRPRHPGATWRVEQVCVMCGATVPLSVAP